MRLHALILAGGSGTRFWPLSRRSRPKQLLKLFSDRPLVRETFERLEGLVPSERVWVVTPASLARDLARDLPGLAPDRFVLEPAARNTGPAVALAAAAVHHADASAAIAILPADHVIRPAAAFRAAIESAAAIAATPGRIVLFGIKPAYPATGYGYIRREVAAPGERRDSTSVGAGAAAVAAFIEKPDAARARALAADPACLWNSGIVVASARTILDAFERVAPDFAAPLRAIRDALGAGASAGDAAISAAYLGLPEGPFDKAVLERWPDISVIEAPFDWDDVGDFRAVERHVAADSSGNVGCGSALFLDGSRGCTVVSPAGSPLVIASGIEDLLVVATGDAVLVCRKGDGEAIRGVVEAVRRAGRADLLE